MTKEAPERIWVIKNGHGRGRDMASTRGDVWDQDPSATSYIRADLAQPAQVAVNEEQNSPQRVAFWTWLPRAYRDGHIGADRKFTKYNMEVAHLAGWQHGQAEAVAGAFLAAGKAALPPGDGWRGALCDAAVIAAQQRVLAATPADAQAALARRDAEVRKAALREAAALFGDSHTGQSVERAILALIKEPVHD